MRGEVEHRTEVQRTIGRATVIVACAGLIAIACGSEREVCTSREACEASIDARPVAAIARGDPFEELERHVATRAAGRVQGEVGGAIDTAPGFPVDVPPYPGSQLVAAFEEESVGRVRMYATSDPPDRVEAFFRRRLAEDGWQLDSTESGCNADPIAFSRERDQLRLAVEPHRRGALVSLGAPIRR
jgi:hypothetical protein